MTATRTYKSTEIEYPESDGKPMAETDDHRDWMIATIQRLQRRYAGQRVYVSGNLLVYYQEGDPRKCVAPDTFVVKNCRPGRRRIFKIWEEGRTPNFALETTSKKSRREDKGPKKEIYAKLGVKEYFLYDPLGEWLKPPLQGFRLVDGDYQAIEPDADGGMVSRELGVRFVLENGDLTMFDTNTGERLLSQEEWRKRETQRADEAEERARALELELARLKETTRKPNGHKRKNGKS